MFLYECKQTPLSPDYPLSLVREEEKCRSIEQRKRCIRQKVQVKCSCLLYAPLTEMFGNLNPPLSLKHSSILPKCWQKINLVCHLKIKQALKKCNDQNHTLFTHQFCKKFCSYIFDMTYTTELLSFNTKNIPFKRILTKLALCVQLIQRNKCLNFSLSILQSKYKSISGGRLLFCTPNNQLRIHDAMLCGFKKKFIQRCRIWPLAQLKG